MTASGTLLRDVPIAALRPTQMCVGYREVDVKRKAWFNRPQTEPVTVPVVIGPRQTLFLVDRHHLMRALLHEGAPAVTARPVADLNALTMDAFWQEMHHRGWCRPHDESGLHRPFHDIPRSLHALRDDPYRSLAGALRRARGFHKRMKPYSEFIWADFLRERITRDALADFPRAVADALALARSQETSHLPGWISNATAASDDTADILA